jgi:hypothetical protein
MKLDLCTRLLGELSCSDIIVLNERETTVYLKRWTANFGWPFHQWRGRMPSVFCNEEDFSDALHALKSTGGIRLSESNVEFNEFGHAVVEDCWITFASSSSSYLVVEATLPDVIRRVPNVAQTVWPHKTFGAIACNTTVTWTGIYVPPDFEGIYFRNPAIINDRE